MPTGPEDGDALALQVEAALTAVKAVAPGAPAVATATSAIATTMSEGLQRGRLETFLPLADRISAIEITLKLARETELGQSGKDSAECPVGRP